MRWVVANRDLLFRVCWPFLRRLPTRLGSVARVAAVRFAGGRIGSACTIGPGVRILNPSGLTMRSGAGVARDVTLDARGEIDIGSRAMVGLESLLLTQTHAYDRLDRAIADQGATAGPVVVGDGAWIAARAIVLPGANVGQHSIVGAASIVTGTVPDFAVAAGSPARLIRDRRQRASE